MVPHEVVMVAKYVLDAETVIGGGVDWLSAGPFGGAVVVQAAFDADPVTAAGAEVEASGAGVVAAGVVAVAVAAGGVVVCTFFGLPVSRVSSRIPAMSTTTTPRKMFRLRRRRRSAAFFS